MGSMGRQKEKKNCFSQLLRTFNNNNNNIISFYISITVKRSYILTQRNRLKEAYFRQTTLSETTLLYNNIMYTFYIIIYCYIFLPSATPNSFIPLTELLRGHHSSRYLYTTSGTGLFVVLFRATFGIIPISFYFSFTSHHR